MRFSTISIDSNHAALVETETMEVEDPNGGKLFPGTRWSLVAQSREPEAANRALSELCQIYWYPVYAYIRSMDKRHHVAQDLTQAFFVSLLDREDFAKADPQRGRLRTFLCVAVKRFVISAHREKTRLKRGGGVFVLSIDAEEADGLYRIEPREEETPETYFDRRWATTVIETAIATLKDEYASKGREKLFAALRPYLSSRSGDERQDEVAAGLGIKVGTLRMAVNRLRQRYGELLRSTVADTLADPTKADEELGHLFEVFQR